MGKKEEKKREMLVGARSRVLELKVVPKHFGPAACICFEKKVSHYAQLIHA